MIDNNEGDETPTEAEIQAAVDDGNFPDEEAAETIANDTVTEGDGSLDDSNEAAPVEQVPDFDPEADDSDDEDDSDEDGDEPVDPPTDDTDPGEPDDFTEDPDEPPAEAEPDGPPTTVQT